MPISAVRLLQKCKQSTYPGTDAIVFYQVSRIVTCRKSIANHHTIIEVDISWGKVELADKNMLPINSMMQKATLAIKHIKCLQIFGKMSKTKVGIIDQYYATIHIKCIHSAAKVHFLGLGCLAEDIESTRKKS